MTSDQALEAIEPLEEVLDIGGNTIRVRPITVGRLAGFSRSLRPILPDLEMLFTANEGGQEIAYTDILALLEKGESLIDAVAYGAGVDRDWLADRTPDVLIKLAAAVISVNSDFFARALVPVTVAAIGRVQTVATGTASSPGSSGPDSPGPT